MKFGTLVLSNGTCVVFHILSTYSADISAFSIVLRKSSFLVRVFRLKQHTFFIYDIWNKEVMTFFAYIEIFEFYKIDWFPCKV